MKVKTKHLRSALKELIENDVFIQKIADGLYGISEAKMRAIHNSKESSIIFEYVTPGKSGEIYKDMTASEITDELNKLLNDELSVIVVGRALSKMRYPKKYKNGVATYGIKHIGKAEKTAKNGKKKKKGKKNKK